MWYKWYNLIMTMDEIKLGKAVLVTEQILLYFIDVYKTIIPIFDKARVYRVPIKMYDKFRRQNKLKFSQEMYRLKKAGVVKEYFDGKERFLELTLKGKEKLKRQITNKLEVQKPKKWDKKWRVVIFDIPNSKKLARDIFREKLESIGFLKLQESVYVFPFECKPEINLLKNMYNLSQHVQYLLVDRIESERNLIEKFYDRNLISEN